MSAKKTNFIIPEKSTQNIDAWVAEGGPKSTETQKSALAEKTSVEKMKRLTIDLDAKTHKIFKLKALSNDTNMVDLVRLWIRDFINNR